MKYEEILKRDFNFQSVNIKGFDDRIIEEMIKTLDIIYSKYPELCNTICQFGDKKQTTSDLKTLNRGKFISTCKIIIALNSPCIAKSIFFKNESEDIYVSVFFNNKFHKLCYEDIIRYVYDTCQVYEISIRHIISHEFGHVLANCLNLYEMDEIKKILEFNFYNNKAFIEKLISHHVTNETEMTKFVKEAFAELFARSIYSKSTPLIEKIMDATNERYKEVDKDCFNVQDRYNKIIIKGR